MKQFIFCLITIFTFYSSQAQWVQTSLDSFTVSTLVVNGAHLFAGTSGKWEMGNAEGIFLSTNNGEHWNAVNSGLPKYNYFYPSVGSLTIDGVNIFAGTFEGIFLSTNNGTNWDSVNTGMTGKNVKTLALSGKNLFAGTWYDGIFLSTDNGKNWNAVNQGLPKNGYDSSLYFMANAIVFSGTNIFAGTPKGVFLSTNYGANWDSMNTGLTNTYVKTLAVSDTVIFAGTEIGVFLSTNNGTTWNAVNTGLTDKVTAIAISGKNLFAGTGGMGVFGTDGNGIFLSTNHGNSWIDVNGEFTARLSVNCFAIIDTNLFVGTYDRGVWRRPLSEMITDAKQLSSHLPQNYSLSQNYPNPFNPSTVISYQLPVISKVTLKIYDLLGREVTTLVNEEQSAGKYNYELQIRNYELASGVYFYRLHAGDFIETKKMLVIK
ncbi:MAG: T9SS type A sorting domain-containing protein [Ignavibacteriaceae bacterium]|jgi:ligand-binding sensor domain-containing protein